MRVGVAVVVCVCVCVRVCVCTCVGGVGSGREVASTIAPMSSRLPPPAEMIGPFNKARGIALVMVGSAVTGSFGPQVRARAVLGGGDTLSGLIERQTNDCLQSGQ